MKKQVVNYLFMFALILGIFTSCAKSSGSDEDDTADAKSVGISEKTVYELADKYQEKKMSEEEYNQALDLIENYDKIFTEKVEEYIKNADNENSFYRQIRKLNGQYYFMDELMPLLWDEYFCNGFSVKTIERRRELENKHNRVFESLQDKANKKFSENSVDSAVTEVPTEAVAEDDYYDYMQANDEAPQAVEAVEQPYYDEYDYAK